MERLTQKHDVFDYILPEQNIVGDNQATEVILGETEYICKKYIIGEAIKKLGELEDVLEKYDIETTEELDGVLKPLIDNGELENWKSAIFWKMQTERLNKELAELKQQLAEKDEQLRAKIGSMKSNDFIKMCLQCGLMIDAKEKDNQDKISFAIEQLEKVKMYIDDHAYYIDEREFGIEINEYIDNQIESLKGEE